jgi:chromosome segregation ATPase
LEEEKETLLENLSVSDVVEIEDKVSQLKTALDESKRNEAALENELQRLRKEIVSLNESNGAMTDLQTTLNEVYSSVSILEKERASLQDTLRESKICMDEKALDLESKLQEKEAVIIKLQKSCVDYEQQLASFQNSPEASQNLSSLESFQKLQDENEIFACQIIEQEEELEQLKSKLEEKNRCYDSLENDMKELRVKLDLLESTNASLRNDIEKRKAMVNVGDGEEMQINALGKFCSYDKMTISMSSPDLLLFILISLSPYQS